MDELSREEQLKRRIHEKKKACEREKGLRVKRTFLFLSVGIYVIAFMEGAIRGSITDYLMWILLAPIMAGITMFISALVLLHILIGAIGDATSIAKLEGELNAIKYSKWN